MPANPSYGLEQARIQLPAIIADAHSGVTSVITRHGKPYAAVVPFKNLENHVAHCARRQACWPCVARAKACGVPTLVKPLTSCAANGVTIDETRQT